MQGGLYREKGVRLSVRQTREAYCWGCLGVLLQHPQAVGEVGNF